jgi:hypothetical protein
MADPPKVLFYVFQNGQEFCIVEMSSTHAGTRPGPKPIAEENTLKAAITTIKTKSKEPFAFVAKCDRLGHRHAACYWPVGESDSAPRTCPDHGCGHKPLDREEFND